MPPPPPPPPPPPQQEAPSPALKPAEIRGRGRSLIAARTIKPGEVILSDSPLLLYRAATTTTSCSHCFRSLTSSSPIPCPSSCFSFFCSPLCLSSHPPPLCNSLRHLLPSSDPDLAAQSRFLAAAHALSLSSPSAFSLLLSLHGGGDPVHPSLPSLFPPDLTSALLAKDRLNAFGLMEPFRQGEERRVRAYGIYPHASLFNHDCLPNACRFDYVDAADETGRRNTDIVVRAIHEISEGREVCLSYFPVNWGYKERQGRLLEDYGFRCECDRCLVERNWKDDDDDEEKMGEGSDGGDEGMDDMEEEEEEETGGDFPHAYFFLKFVCDREGCGGTLAPLSPSPEGVVSDVMECNVCGQLRKEEDVDGNGDGDGDMIDDE